LASPHVINLVKQELDEADEALRHVRTMLECAARHQSDVVVGKYTIHRSEDGMLSVRTGNRAFEPIDEFILEHCIGMAVTKTKGEG
jgi:hypothetical protein